MIDSFEDNRTNIDFFQNQAVRHSTFIHTNPMQVYHTLTSPQGLDAWLTTCASVQAKKDVEINFRWVNWGSNHISTQDGGLVLVAITGKCFVFQWNPDVPDYPTTVEINLTNKDGGTIVSFREQGFAATPSGLQAMVDCATGWGEALTLLKYYLEYELHY